MDGTHPARRIGKMILETLETVAPSFRYGISRLHACLFEKIWPITVNLLIGGGKRECQERGVDSPLDQRNFSNSSDRGPQRLPEPVAPAIAKSDRRPLRINTI
jgi:hypothetical protein